MGSGAGNGIWVGNGIWGCRSDNPFGLELRSRFTSAGLGQRGPGRQGMS